jgi:hypothetical protein
MDIQPEQNEQKIKKPSFFLEIEDKCVVVITSKLFRFQSHYIESARKSVACVGQDCVFCKSIRPRTEYIYAGSVNGDFGVIRLPASVFFDMNENERLTKKDKRHQSWIIGKTGQGLDTRYKAVALETVKITDSDIEKNTVMLTEKLKIYANLLEKSYNELAPNETFKADQDDIILDDVEDNKTEEMPF